MFLKAVTASKNSVGEGAKRNEGELKSAANSVNTAIRSVPKHCGDIDVVENKKLLICPTLFNNKVIAYRIID
jgi:hypothetical protein